MHCAAMSLEQDTGETGRSQCSSIGHSRTPGDALCLNKFAHRGVDRPLRLSYSACTDENRPNDLTQGGERSQS